MWTEEMTTTGHASDRLKWDLPLNQITTTQINISLQEFQFLVNCGLRLTKNLCGSSIVSAYFTVYRSVLYSDSRWNWFGSARSIPHHLSYKPVLQQLLSIIAQCECKCKCKCKSKQ